MKLYDQLKLARSEEDVKDAYIKALGLKSYTKGLIDIRTDEIWFEAKDTAKHSSYAMFTQLLHKNNERRSGPCPRTKCYRGHDPLLQQCPPKRALPPCGFKMFSKLKSV